MADLWRRGWCLATGLLVPALALGSPRWLLLDAVAPAWSVLWLLPWALADGPFSGALVGAALGLLLDADRRGQTGRAAAHHHHVIVHSLARTVFFEQGIRGHLQCSRGVQT